MGVTLFGHNADAYQNVQKMFQTVDRCCIVHATGTGKSFIGFTLCADHPTENILWLSPSDYIVRTQLARWKESGGEDLPNIRFVTYPLLMMMNPQEIRDLQPQYIIMDEFHRCGATVWGEGVQRLLAAFPKAKVLGLSATHIRYLDNQRDMAEELFDGNIASELSLGEAIARGILECPEYVLSAFSWQKDLERYQKRVDGAKNPVVREQADQYLQALRRALDKADGLSDIFDRHMPNRKGRYIVFCSNFAHMQEMMEKASEWFTQVDPAPHLYPVYSEDAEASQAFRDFTVDESDHLKLLYCIDMLNEGIHVQDVSGVILLRPTVSPIVYRQQIGRALSAGSSHTPVIFDIVMNIDNLYSISSIESEIETVAALFRERNQSFNIVKDHFTIIDELKDCRQLFARLNDCLQAGWDTMYREAENYYITNHNLEVPKRYITENGLALGQWLTTQRRVRAGQIAGSLSSLQIARLDSIGMNWDNGRDRAWNKNFEAAKAWYQEHGDLLVPAEENDYHGVALGRWIAHLRVLYNIKDKTTDVQEEELLTEERIQQLDSIGMIWNIPDMQWERNYNAARRYYLHNGTLAVPSRYVDPDGIRLGAWLTRMRYLYRHPEKGSLSQEKIRRLSEIGMQWKEEKTA